MKNRLIRWFGRAIAWSIGAIIFIITTAYMGAISSPGNEWIRQQVLNAAAPAFPEGELVINSVNTNLLGHIELLGIGVRDVNQKPLIQIDRVYVGYDLLALLNNEVSVESIRLEGPKVDLKVNEEGRVDLMEVFGPVEESTADEPAEPFAGLPVDVSVDQLAIVDGSLVLQDSAGGVRIPDFNVSLRAETKGSSVLVSAIDMDLDVEQPIDQVVTLDGVLSLSSGNLNFQNLAMHLGGIGLAVNGNIKAVETRPDMELSLQIDPVDPLTLEALAGQSVISQAITLQTNITGPLSAIQVDGVVPLPNGTGKVGLNLTADLESEPMAWGISLTPQQFAVHTITDLVPAPLVLDGRYTVSGTGTDYPLGIDAEIRADCGAQVFAGESVDSMNIHGRLDAGRLGLDVKELFHEVAEVSLVANVDLLNSTAKARASIHVPDAGKLRKYGVHDMGGTVRYDGDIEAAWDPDVDVDVDGELMLSSFVGPGVSVAMGGGPIQVRMRGEQVGGTGDVRLEGVDASGTAVDEIQLVFEGVRTTAGNVEVNADLQIGLVSMPDGQFDMQGLEGKMTANIPASGQMQASADMTVKTFRFGDGDYSVDGGPVQFGMVGDHITADVDIRRRNAPFLTGTIDGDLNSGLWSIEGFRFALLEGDGFDAEQNMQFRLADDGAKDILVELFNADGKGRLKIEGQATTDSPDIKLTAEKIDLSYIVEMLGEVIDLDVLGQSPDSDVDTAPIPLDALSGLASVDLAVQGQGGVINANGWIQIEDLVLPGYINRLDGRIDVALTNTTGSIRIEVSDNDEMLFWSSNEVPIVQERGVMSLNCDAQLHMRTILPGTSFRSLAKRIPAIDADLRGRASLDVHAQGNACDPRLGVVAAMDTALGMQGERVRLDIEFERDGDNLELRTAVQQEIQRIAEINAVLATHLTDALTRLLRDGEEVDVANPDTWLDSFYVNFQLQQADVGRLARMGAVTHPIEGILEGGVELSGTITEPKVEAGIVWADGRIGEANMSQFTIDLDQKDNVFDLQMLLDFVDEGGLEISGKIPLELRLDRDLDLDRPGLQIDISGDGVPLAMAAGPSGLAEPSGTIRLGGQVSGSLASPTPKLTVQSKDAGFTLLATGLRYEPLNLGVEYEPERITFRDVSIRSSQLWGQNPKSGTFSLDGSIGLGEGGPTDMSIATKMDEFWLSATRQANVATSGEVRVSGKYPNLNIRGKVAMDEASIAVGEEVLKDTSGFEIDETIQLHREKREVVSGARKEELENSVADNFAVDLEVDLAQNVRLRADVPLSEDFGSQFSQLATLSLDIGVDGLLDITQEHGVLSVVGELATMRGEMVAMGKRFSLTEGDITFTGENYVNPQLSILAAHQVGQYGTVDIAISGDVENTSMELSSAEYPDETDVMSMLLFGKPTSAMSETEGESGAGLLSAAMASVGGQAARATGAAFLQNVQIDPGSGSVKVGFPLTDKIYLSIEKVTPEEDTDNVTQAALEWILSRQTYGELITGDRGQSSGDLYWRWRF